MAFPQESVFLCSPCLCSLHQPLPETRDLILHSPHPSHLQDLPAPAHCPLNASQTPPNIICMLFACHRPSQHRPLPWLPVPTLHPQLSHRAWPDLCLALNLDLPSRLISGSRQQGLPCRSICNNFMPPRPPPTVVCPSPKALARSRPALHPARPNHLELHTDRRCRPGSPPTWPAGSPP